MLTIVVVLIIIVGVNILVEYARNNEYITRHREREDRLNWSSGWEHYQKSYTDIKYSNQWG